MKTKETDTGSIPETTGQTIPWASIYDCLVWAVSMGKINSTRREIVKLTKIKTGEVVLDIGCGTGGLLMEIQDQIGNRGNLIGIDASPKMISVAKHKVKKTTAEINFHVGLIEEIALPDEHCDIVLNSLVMHHLPDDLKQAGLTEMYRVLKPFGRILIVDIESSSGGSLLQKFADFIIHLHGGHAIMHDNVQKLVPLVKEVGFKNIETGKLNRQMSYINADKR